MHIFDGRGGVVGSEEGVPRLAVVRSLRFPIFYLVHVWLKKKSVSFKTENSPGAWK